MEAPRQVIETYETWAVISRLPLLTYVQYTCYFVKALEITYDGIRGGADTKAKARALSHS